MSGVAEAILTILQALYQVLSLLSPTQIGIFIVLKIISETFSLMTRDACYAFLKFVWRQINAMFTDGRHIHQE